MSNEKQSIAPEEIAQRLLPERLAYLLSERPILWSESADDYDALLGEIFAELDPKGAIEVILVKDIVDYVWEARRMRALKVAALHAELPHAAGRLFGTPGAAGFGPQRSLRHLNAARAAVAGVRVEQQFLEGELAREQMTPKILQYDAMKEGMTTLTAIDASITRLERRRDQLLKQLSDRRMALKAMARGLIERETAEAVDDVRVD